MFKLLKYEFIKNRVALIIISALLLISEGLFLFGFATENDKLIGTAIVLLVLLAPVCIMGGLIIGAGTYTKELSNKVGFLVYMTPNSSFKIVGSKFIFTAIMEVVYSIVLGIFAYIDMAMMLKQAGIDAEFYSMLEEIAAVFGMNITEILVTGVASFITSILSLIMIVAIYYVAYTLSATFMQASKARGFVAVLLFFLGDYVIIKISTLLPEIEYSAVTNGLRLSSIIPIVLYSMAVIAVSYISCSYMLDKKVSL